MKKIQMKEPTTPAFLGAALEDQRIPFDRYAHRYFSHHPRFVIWAMVGVILVLACGITLLAKTML